MAAMQEKEVTVTAQEKWASAVDWLVRIIRFGFVEETSSHGEGQPRKQTLASIAWYTGLYHGFAEPPGVAVICLNCDGTGAHVIKYQEYSGCAKVRKDIHTVRRSAGTFIATGVGPTGNSISYNDFLAGKRP